MTFIRGRKVVFVSFFFYFFLFLECEEIIKIKQAESWSHFLVMPLSDPQAGFTAVLADAISSLNGYNTAPVIFCM